VGAEVRRRRQELGLNQTELGRRAGGLTQDYISKLENGVIDTPQRGTMDALATALQLPVSALYRAAGILEGVVNEPTPEPARVIVADKEYDPRQIVAFVRAHPDKDFQAQLDRQEQRRTPENFQWLCLRIFRAWTSNAELAMYALEPVEN
jgi:transcriptional regulator with XRE-family HTH domain